MWTDVSILGIGAILMQTYDRKRPHVIAYASHIDYGAKAKYSIIHLEAFTVIWVLKNIWDIIHGYPITIYTVHTAVTKPFKGANLTGQLAICYLTIQQFSPAIKYLPGKSVLLPMHYLTIFPSLQLLRFLISLFLILVELSAKTLHCLRSSVP